MARIDSRANEEPRQTSITTGHQAFAEGSALIQMGQTRVLCAATIEERVPHFLKGRGQGWVTAEYGMLPRSTSTRTPRESATGRPRGRTLEIQRLIGRSLRAVTNLEALGERTILLDCDVLQADGGTRTAAVTGAYVAMYQAVSDLFNRRILATLPLHNAVAATSVGIVEKEAMVDLCYEEDFRASVDFNVVMTAAGDFVEVQGAAEKAPFSKTTLDSMLSLAEKAIQHLFGIQNEAIQQLGSKQ